MADKPIPVTFAAPSYALFDEEANGVLTTQFGSLAIFSTQGMAEHVARSSGRKITVMPIMVTPVARH